MVADEQLGFPKCANRQPFGVTYGATAASGQWIEVTEAQVVASVLENYAAQMQLVGGVMILPADLRSLLTAHGVVS